MMPPQLQPRKAACVSRLIGHDHARSFSAQLHRIVLPLEQPNANEFLERLDTARQRRRGQRKGFGSRLDRAQTGDMDEGLHRADRRQPAH